MGLTNIRTVPGVFPTDTGKEISNRRFSLVHIDVDVYKSAKACFEWALLDCQLEELLSSMTTVSNVAEA